MRRTVAKLLRKEAAKAFPKGSSLTRRRDGSWYWTGRIRAYKELKRAHKGVTT